MARVLLAEDNVVNRKIIETMVHKGGFDVHPVVNGLDALHAVENEDYLCVLMDIHMPEMDGLEATRHIRSLTGCKGQVPIIAVTATVIAGMRDKAIKAGINKFLCKPVGYKELIATIRQYGLN